MSHDFAQLPLIGSLASSLGSGLRKARNALFGSTDAADPPSAQTFAPTPAMPVASTDDAAMQEAKKRSLSEQIARRGRASTILTNDSGEKLGG